MQGSSTGLLSDVQVDDEIRYWREQHRHGELGYCDFEAVPVATVRKVCEIFAAEPALSESEATRSALQQLRLPAGSLDAALAAWLASRCWRRLHGAPPEAAVIAAVKRSAAERSEQDPFESRQASACAFLISRLQRALRNPCCAADGAFTPERRFFDDTGVSLPYQREDLS